MSSWEDWDDDQEVMTEPIGSWEDEDLSSEEEPKNTTPKGPPPGQNQSKKKTRRALREILKAQKEAEERAETLTAEEKQQRQEESDLQNAVDLFAGVDDRPVLTSQIDPSKIKLQTLRDHQDYGKQVAAELIQPYDQSLHYFQLVKALIQESLIPLTGEQLNQLSSLINTQTNLKLAAERKAEGKKTKKVAPKVNKEYLYEDLAEDDYDGFM